MLPQWNPDRLVRKVPFNLALVGGRRQGKSTACSHLVAMMKNKFDLVIAFIGSAAANPVLHQLMVQHWDPRFFFAKWDTNLIDCLLKQQEDAGPDKRSILILVDDVILSSNAEEQLAHMALRGRHFNISLCMAAVSYTSLPKRVRRSLDILFCYSCTMQGDRKILMWEYAGNATMAGFMLKNLGDHECLVLETNRRRQDLKIWKAGLLTPEDFRGCQNGGCITHAELKRRAFAAKFSARPLPFRQEERCGVSRRTRSPERGPAACDEDEKEPVLPASRPCTGPEGPL